MTEQRRRSAPAGRKKVLASAPKRQRATAEPKGERRARPRGALAASPAASESAGPPSLQPRREAAVAFPIVGVGASAGGLEALEQFLGHVPASSGLAFVIVQHLDPTHKGMMAELLQRSTTMKVVEVCDRQKVEPDRVYVIPPNSDMVLLHGLLHLLPPTAPRGLRLPIDFFFRSLAADQRGRSVGVILSGMGSDGTLGLRAIKEQAGVVFVQTPASAKFDAMPRSAIDAGLADVVAPAEELGPRLIEVLGRVARDAAPGAALAGKAQGAVEKICALLRAATGNDFTLYKRSTVYRRIERRMALHQVETTAGYVRLLQENPQETQLLFKELLIGVTSFFRDGSTWEELKRAILPMLTTRPANRPLRAWVPGCSTGEEAYSLAMIFKEALAKAKATKGISLQIFATDLDTDAIDRARQGLYPANIASDVSPERLRAFFVQEGPSYRVRKSIREMVVFAPQNLIMDPPFTKLDLLSCRNLLIYLAPELQKQLLPLFHYSLNPGGILLLGSAETIGTFSDLFTPIAVKSRLYQRLEGSPLTATSGLGPAYHAWPRVAPQGLRASGQPDAKGPVANLATLADQLLLAQHTPAAVLTNAAGDVLYVNGRTGKYLEPAAGKANWNIHALARDGLRQELGAAFRQAVRTKRKVVQPRVKLEGGDGAQLVEVTIEPLRTPEALQGMVLILFANVPAPAVTERAGSAKRAAARETDHELRRAREELQTTREEMQASQEELQSANEELQSANEELQSTNEELQSTNEELTTSREEMQSLNEELQTVNAELQAKVDELSRSTDDMRNLLDSTDIATLFLDHSLNVRRFTASMAQIIKLIPSDIGRPITDLASELVYPELASDARAVLRSLVFRETEIATTTGRWFAARIMPYRTLDDRIDGLVITFSNITAAKVLEGKLRGAQLDKDGSG